MYNIQLKHLDIEEIFTSPQIASMSDAKKWLLFLDHAIVGMDFTEENMVSLDIIPSKGGEETTENVGTLASDGDMEDDYIGEDCSNNDYGDGWGDQYQKRKILISDWWDGPWSANYIASGHIEIAKYLLEYQPIIEFLESGGKFKREDCHGKLHPILAQLRKECLEKFNYDVCPLHAVNLAVREVMGRVRINEYDGRESIEEEGEFVNWL